FLTTPFSIQAIFSLGSRDEDQGEAGSFALKGSVRSVMISGKSFSPSSVSPGFPPFLLRNDRPCSAARALKPKPRYPSRSLTAAGSRITVYLPGSRRFLLAPLTHFSMAMRAASWPERSLMEVEVWEAQPELEPEASRMVLVRAASVYW